jgi:hypothetical protein
VTAFSERYINDIEHINQKIEIWDSKPAPCASCDKATKCALSDIACYAFYKYVRLEDDYISDKKREPSQKWYTRIYRVASNERAEPTPDTEASSQGIESSCLHGIGIS